MRLVVLSDTHGRPSLIDRVLRSEKDAKEVFFLGDIVSDIEEVMPEFGDRNFHIVKGNCDYFCSYPVFDIKEYPHACVYYTHGHKYFVKSGTEVLCSTARSTGANVVLFGHTHIPSVEYEGGIYLINSGSLALPRELGPSYAVIDITEKGILPAIKYI